MTVIERARKYIEGMPQSIQGQRGSDAIFDVAQVLMRGFTLDEADGVKLIIEWNYRNSCPPWKDADLQHKIRDARDNGRKPMGYLLTNESPPKSGGIAGILDRESEEKAKKRAVWPTLYPITMKSVPRIAALRKLPEDAVYQAMLAGYLFGGKVDGHHCFVIKEGTFAQARRFDGEMLPTAGGPKKAKNLPGSEGKFIGRKTLGDRSVPVLLVEGVVGLLEGMAAVWAMDAPWTVLAATSASSRFDDQSLKLMEGRRVRIVPDTDVHGVEALAKWTASLRSVGASVDAFRLPDGVKDLGPLVADIEAHRQTLTELFA